MNRKTVTREWLYDQYIVQKLGTRAVAKKLDCSRNTVCKLLHAHNIKVRPPNTPYKGPRIPKKICKICGKEYKPHTFERAKKSHACSEKCYGIFVQNDPELRQIAINNLPQDTRGENNGNWHGGTSREPYPFDFDLDMKDQIRQLDNFTCQLCSKSQDENIKQYSERLSCHHINYLKEDLQPKNLISLCRNCHARVHGKTQRLYWQSLFETKIIQIYSGAEP